MVQGTHLSKYQWMDLIWALEGFEGFKPKHLPKLLTPKPDQITSNYPRQLSASVGVQEQYLDL